MRAARLSGRTLLTLLAVSATVTALPALTTPASLKKDVSRFFTSRIFSPMAKLDEVASISVPI